MEKQTNSKLQLISSKYIVKENKIRTCRNKGMIWKSENSGDFK